MYIVKRLAKKDCQAFQKKSTDKQSFGKYVLQTLGGTDMYSIPRKYSIHCETTADLVLQNSNESWKYQRLRTILQRTVYLAFLFISEFITGALPVSRYIYI